MLANLERSELAADPVQRAWMCELHLAIPGIAFQEQIELADQLAATGDVMRAAHVFEALADGPSTRRPRRTRADTTPERLRMRARALRARLN